MSLKSEEIQTRQLTHVYVALAMARDVAQQCSVRGDCRPLLTTLDVAVELLEEVMQKALPEELPSPSVPVLSSENVM